MGYLRSENLVALESKAKSMAIGDEFPPESHQNEVHRLATDLLKCLVAGYTADRDPIPIDLYPILGFEVYDEALVLYKNDPRAWPIGFEGQTILALGYKICGDIVADIRNGRPRTTTTPTLRGGGKRARR